METGAKRLLQTTTAAANDFAETNTAIELSPTRSDQSIGFLLEAIGSLGRTLFAYCRRRVSPIYQVATNKDCIEGEVQICNSQVRNFNLNTQPLELFIKGSFRRCSIA